MSKILAFGASSSNNSMNKKLASFVANKIAPQEAILIDLNDYEMPIYSDDRKKADGIPEKAYEFKNLIKASDGIIISLAEHNGSYTAAFKNIYDWISVIEEIVWNYKPILLLSASNGSRGGKSVMSAALSRFSIQSKFEIPNFSLQAAIKKGAFAALLVVAAVAVIAASTTRLTSSSVTSITTTTTTTLPILLLLSPPVLLL